MNVIKNKDNKSSNYSWVLFGTTAILFGIVFHFYLPNLGGAGLAIPLNIVSAFFIALFIVVTSILQINKTSLTYSMPSHLISLGLIILIILCVFAPADYRYNAYLTAYWIVGALLFYQLLMQLNISLAEKKMILFGILLAGVIESVFAMAQVFKLLPVYGLPYPPLAGDRPYGIFQQVNVFSSFICVGIASAIGLLTQLKNITWKMSVGIIMSLILMSSTLPLSQSLTGYLSLFLIVIAFYFFEKESRKNILFYAMFIVVGLIIGLSIKLGLHISDVSESKFTTSHIRWMLWKYSLYLFYENSLWGSGVGSFESLFLERFGGGLLGTSERVMSHPHNEILRWMVEGGIIGLIAIFFIFIGGVYLLYSSRKNNNKNYMYLVIVLPILFHMMTEFPLWLSMPHGIVLILLLRCADTPTKKYTVNKIMGYLSKGIIVFFGLLSMVLLSVTLQAQQYLTYIEKTGQQTLLSMEKPKYNQWNYYFIYDRYKLDLNMGYLLRYNETQNPYFLELFNVWAEEYSRSYPDINVYLSWVLVLNELGEKEKAREIKFKADYLFDNNERLAQLNL